MEFRELTDAEYRDLLGRQDRVYLSQLVEYGDARRLEGTVVQRVGLLADDGTPLGAATIYNQPWKKVFFRAIAYYGPMVDFMDESLALNLVRELVRWVKKDPRVLALRVNPFVHRRPYRDITPGEESEEARAVDRVMALAGATKVKGEYQDGVSVAANFLYTKDLGRMNYEEVLASTGNNVRAGIRKAASNGVKVEYLGTEDFAILRDVLDHTAERTEMPPVLPDDLERARQLMRLMGPETCHYMVAILDAEETLRAIDTELESVKEELAHFDELEKDRQLTRKQHNAREQLRDRINGLLRRRDKTERVRSKHGEKVVLTASQFIETPTDMIFYYSGGYSDLADYRGIYAVHNEMMKRAVQKGLRWYNLNVIPGVFDAEQPGYGLVDYKRNFHGNVEELVGTYEFAIRPRLAKWLGAIQP